MGTHTAPTRPFGSAWKGPTNCLPGFYLMAYSPLQKALTSPGTHLDDDQAFPGAQFVGNCAEDFLHRGSHRYPDGCVGVVHAIDFKQNYWEDSNNKINWSWEFLKKTISYSKCLDVSSKICLALPFLWLVFICAHGCLHLSSSKTYLSIGLRTVHDCQSQLQKPQQIVVKNPHTGHGERMRGMFRQVFRVCPCLWVFLFSR